MKVPALCLFVVAMGALPGCRHAEHTIPLGRSVLLEKDVRYTVADTDVVVCNLGARARSFLVDGDPNKESHEIDADLDLAVGGQQRRAEVSNSNPVEWNGYRFSIDPLDFTWGSPSVKVRVERIAPH